MHSTPSGAATLTLPSDREILITREFNAPRHLVYTAWTTPELVGRWWTAKRGKIMTAEIDLRPGGHWRYVMIAEGGEEVGFHGEFVEIVENERIVSTEVYEGAPPEAQPALNTATFTDIEGRTRLTLLMALATKADRDMVIASGMESGLQDALELLEEVAIALA